MKVWLWNGKLEKSDDGLSAQRKIRASWMMVCLRNMKLNEVSRTCVLWKLKFQWMMLWRTSCCEIWISKKKGRNDKRTTSSMLQNLEFTDCVANLHSWRLGFQWKASGPSRRETWNLTKVERTCMLPMLKAYRNPSGSIIRCVLSSDFSTRIEQKNQVLQETLLLLQTVAVANTSRHTRPLSSAVESSRVRVQAS